jgi:hypothetical protein
MYSDQLAWELKDVHASDYLKMSVEKLKEYQVILGNHDPMLNSDLATMAIYRCQDCVRMALNELDTDLSR